MGTMRRGVHKVLEEEANRLIRESLKGVTKHSDKADILTPWKEAERYRREVYVNAGSPEKAIRQGMFHRVLNPHNPELNSRDGLGRARYATTRSLQTFVDENGCLPGDADLE